MLRPHRRGRQRGENGRAPAVVARQPPVRLLLYNLQNRRARRNAKCLVVLNLSGTTGYRRPALCSAAAPRCRSRVRVRCARAGGDVSAAHGRAPAVVAGQPPVRLVSAPTWAAQGGTRTQGPDLRRTGFSFNPCCTNHGVGGLGTSSFRALPAWAFVARSRQNHKRTAGGKGRFVAPARSEDEGGRGVRESRKEDEEAGFPTDGTGTGGRLAPESAQGPRGSLTPHKAFALSRPTCAETLPGQGRAG